MRKIVAAIVAISAWAMLSSCTPAATITAVPDTTRPACYDLLTINGQIDPAGATTKVVLQRTVGGKWVDWIWYQTGDSDEQAHRLYGVVDSDGSYFLNYNAPWWATTVHLRVRSGGGSVVSPSFYVTTSGPACTAP